MNLREFCGVEGFPTAILTTYTFDPLFFERLVLRDLRDAGTIRIVVLADADESTPVIEASREQIVGLGRHYRVLPVRMQGAFHPKLCIRLGERSALVACGSHNLTRAGWLGLRSAESPGGNREVGGTWRVEWGTPEASSLAGVLGTLSEIAKRGVGSGVLHEVAQTWKATPSSPTTSGTSLLISRPGDTLAGQLEKRWRGRKFTSMQMATGSTDDRGEMIRWAARAFGVKSAVLELDPGLCGFEWRKLNSLGVDLRIIRRGPSPRPHLKVARFDGPQGSAVVYGSANCSAAAWLVPADRGGNIEAVVVMDRCPRSSFGDVLAASSKHAEPWKAVTFAGIPDAPRSASEEAVRLEHLSVTSATGTVDATLQAEIPARASVRIMLDDLDASARRVGEGLYRAVFGPLEPVGATRFGCVEWGEPPVRTNWCWADDAEALASLVRDTVDLSAMGDLGSPDAAPDRVLRGLNRLAEWVLGQRSEPAIEHIGHRERKAEEQEPATPSPVKPADIFRSIAELNQQVGKLAVAEHALGERLSLGGMLKLVLGAGGPRHDENADLIAEEGRRASDSAQLDEEGEGKADNGDTDPLDSIENTITDEDRKRLIAQMTRFMQRIHDEQFAEKATATQLHNAIGFGMGAAILAARGGWIVSPENREEWGEIVHGLCEATLLRRFKVSGSERESLLERVRGRYRDAGVEERFDGIIGNGELWSVMVAAASTLELSPDPFEQALTLHDIVACEHLYSKRSAKRLAELLRVLAVAQDDESWQARAENAHNGVEELIQRLHTDHDRLRSAVRGTPREEDWLWNPHVGFAWIVVPPDEGSTAKVHIRSLNDSLNVRLSHYLNLRLAGIPLVAV